MKKLLMFVLLGISVMTLTGCGLFGGEDDVVPDRYKIDGECDGMSDYIIINGVCTSIDDMLSDNIYITSEDTISSYTNSIELMDDFVADLSGSTGLAVVSQDLLNDTPNSGSATLPKLMKLAADTEAEDAAKNVIVKLTEDGFFEEVDFETADGVQVDITANPLALEVFGPWTIVVFETNADYYDENYQPSFDQKLYDSLYQGGVYLIHNDTGKLFATKNVEYVENTWQWTEDYSRTIWVTVTLGEPVQEATQELRVDDLGNPILDENGNEIWDEVMVTLLDSDGNPIIFTEGAPILTEMVEVPVVEYYKVQQVDTDGNLVFDENGDPVYDIVEEPLLDENGDPVIEMQEVAVTDENGDVVYQQTFDMELYIEDIRTITQTEYYANITDNPISEVAYKFVDQILAEYYNWNYYRVSNYSIQHWGFAETEDYIFFMKDIANETNPSTMERFVMRMGFDTETNELLLEQYINATKANFDQCEIIVDPRNGNIICDPYNWEDDIKIYSPTTGLSVIADSGELTPVTFPNGELYFYASRETYVEELGYYTTLLYTLNEDGTMDSHYIELGERQQLCTDPMYCYNSISVDFFDAEGNQLNEWESWIELDLEEGDAYVSSGDLVLDSLGTFDTARPDCSDTVCWYSVLYTILDGTGAVVAEFDQGDQRGNGEAAPAYGYTYTLDGNETTEYELQWGSTPELCTTEIGCVNDFSFVDYSLNEWGLWLYQPNDYIAAIDDELINYIQMKEVNNATYVYTKDVAGEICPSEFDYCDEYVTFYFYDIDGTKVNEQWDSNIMVQVPGGETIPLYIEYRITENSTTTLETGLCTTSDGCWRYYNVDGHSLSAYYEQGEEMYATIEDVEKTEVTAETLSSEICTNTNGCSLGEEITYTIVDPLGNTLYEFTNTWPWADYGEQLPYQVTAVYDENDADASDVEIYYRYESTQDIRTCEDTTCGKWVDYVIETGTNEWEYLGNVYMTFAQGEQIIYRIILPQGTQPTSVQTDNTCRWDDGCTMYTEDYTIYDENDNEIVINDEYWTPQLPVFFAKGDVMPIDNNFHANFTMINMEYQMRRLYIYDFIYNLNEVVILDENLYLIERESWSEGTDNVILTFNETTGRYAAMYTNLSAVTEITKLGDSYVGINDDETAIYKFTFNETLSSSNYYYFDEENLTVGLSLFGVNDLIIDYDGSIYFKGVNNFIQDITGTIAEDGTVTIDTEYVEREIIRLRPIN